MRKILALAFTATLAAGPALAGDITFDTDTTLSATGNVRSQAVTASGRNSSAQGGVASVQTVGNSSGNITFSRRVDIALDGQVRTQEVVADGANSVAQGGIASIQTAARN